VIAGAARTDEPCERSFTVTLPNSMISIAIARSVIRRITTFESDDAQSSFLVALTEVIGNAMDEHVRMDIAEPITLSVRCDSTDVVSVSDLGAGYDMTDESSAPDDPTHQSGRGLALARAFVPAMGVVSSDVGTTVTLPLVGLGIVR